MLDNKNKTTAHNTSVGADAGQSLGKSTNNSIATFTEKINNNFKDSPESIDDYDRWVRRLNDQNYLQTITMTELYSVVYESKPPLIDGLLYPGTYIFAGAPKMGKSFLMAQFAYHISAGVPLWNYPVRQGTVLYLALEDDYHRLQERMYRMFGTETTDNLYFSVSAGQLGNGLDEQLTGFMSEHPQTRLIIIDTLQKVREIGGDIYSYANDYEIITRLKKFADSYGICMLLVHHTRKQAAEDKFDMISGTNGLLGAADGGFILRKEKRTSNAATLEISGRDQADQKIYLKRNPQTLLWELEKTETELWKEPPEPLLEMIAAKIKDERWAWQGTPSELVDFLGVDMKANALTMKLNINAGRLFDEYGIRYHNKRCHDGRKVSLIYEQRDDV